MTSEATPVQLHEADDVLRQLRELYERSEACKQTTFAFVFHSAYESLADNLATASELMGDESDA